MTKEQISQEQISQMDKTGWRSKPSPNFGLIYRNLDRRYSVELTRFGEWILYRHEGMTGAIVATGECPAKLFLSLLAEGCPFDLPAHP